MSPSTGHPHIARAIYRRYVAFARRASLNPPARGRRGDPDVFAHHVEIARLVAEYQRAYEAVRGTPHGALTALKAELRKLGLERGISDLSAHAKYAASIEERPALLKRHKAAGLSWRLASAEAAHVRQAGRRRRRRPK